MTTQLQRIRPNDVPAAGQKPSLDAESPQRADTSEKTGKKIGKVSMDASALEKRGREPAADGVENDGRAPNHEGTSVPYIDRTEADRYAMAFRPSWAPLSEEDSGHSGHRSDETAVEDLPAEPPPRVAGRRTRRQTTSLAIVSILGFSAATYWGIANTTAPHSESSPIAAKQQPREPEPADIAPPAAPPIEVTPRQEPLRASLVDPDEPHAEPTVSGTEPEAPAEPNTAVAEAPSAPAAPTQPTATARASDPAPPAAAPAVVAAAQPEVSPQPAATAPNVASARPAEATPAAVPAKTPAANHEETTVAHALQAPAAAAPARPAPTPAPPAASAPTIPAPAARAAAPAPATPAPAAPAPLPAPAKPEQTIANAAAASRVTAPASEQMSAPLLVVRALPESARLWLDGQQMANPFDVRLALGSKHKIDARNDGYETTSQTVRIESDAKLTIALRRATPEPAPRVQVRPATPPPAHGAGFVTTNPY